MLLVILSDADRTAFEGMVRFLQKWSGSGPVQGLPIGYVVPCAVQKYACFCAIPDKFTLFDNTFTNSNRVYSLKNYSCNKLDNPKHVVLPILK